MGQLVGICSALVVLHEDANNGYVIYKITYHPVTVMANDVS